MQVEENQLNYLIDTLTCDRNARLDALSAHPSEAKNHDSALRSLDATQKVRVLRRNWENAVQTISTQNVLRCVRDTQHLLENASDTEDRERNTNVVLSILEPLLDKCQDAHLTAGEREIIGSAYTSVLPHALCALLSQKEFTHDVLVVSVCRWSGTDVFRKLFEPYELQQRLSCLEKELCYHFSRGKETTKLSEPQHFFIFLIRSLDRLQRRVSAPPLFEQIRGPVEWRVVSQLRLLWLAVSLLEGVFQWHADSLLLESAPYVVLFLNAFFDFMEAAESRLCNENLYFVGRRVASRQVVTRFLQVCLDTILEALQQGPSKLWRRQFLSSRESSVSPAYYAAVHAVRAVEAVLRRLTSSSSVIERIAMVYVGPCLIEPFLEAFSGFIDDRLEVTTEWTNLETVLYLADLFASLHLIMGAANDWLLLLLQGEQSAGSEKVGWATAAAVVAAAAAAPPQPSLCPAVMERLSTLQEQISSKCLALLTSEVETLSHHVLETSPFVQYFVPFDLFLSDLHCVPCDLLRVLLLNKARQTFSNLLPSEARMLVTSHLHELNLPRTLTLLTA